MRNVNDLLKSFLKDLENALTTQNTNILAKQLYKHYAFRFCAFLLLLIFV